MGYILIYTNLDTTGDYDCWTDNSDEFETYEELIDYMSNMHLRYPDEYRWSYIFKTDDCMLELYLDDVLKEYNSKFEEQYKEILRRKENEAKLAEERAERERIEQIDREKALLRELIKKYGDLV